MESPPRRERRPRAGDTVIDLRQAAASRNRGPEPAGAVPETGDVDLVDQALLDAVHRHGGAEPVRALHELGRHLGSADCRTDAQELERTQPRLEAFDAAGGRVDRVVTHPVHDRLVREGTAAGLAGQAWAATEPHAHLTRAAGLLLWAQTSGSTAMALSTGHAATAALLGTPAQQAWLDRVAPARPAASSRRTAATAERAARGTGGPAGIALTEPTSSSTAPVTTAVPALGGPLPGGPTWRLSGRKWFAGNADADVLVVSAATPDGPGMFLLPRRSTEGAADGAVRTERLRPGNAFAAWVVGDLRLDQAWAVRLDSPGAPRSAATVTARLHAARDLDACVLGAATMRGALTRAGHHARHRTVGGGPLDATALVRTLLADLAVESEAATVLALRLAAATDHATPHEAALLRLAGPVAAAWLSRRAPMVTLEATELLGAAAWDAGSELGRLHRDASAVLAGRTGNGLALHVVDVVSHDPEAVESFLLVCEQARGEHPRLDRALDSLAELLRAAAAEARMDPVAVQGAARLLVERCAVVLQASLVLRGCPGPVAEAFLASRLDGSSYRGLGTLPLGSRQTALVVDRALGDA